MKLFEGPIVAEAVRRSQLCAAQKGSETSQPHRASVASAEAAITIAHWNSPGFVDIPGSMISTRGVTDGKTQATQVYPAIQG
jgi:hypothetical protein